jgi:hypothetical protein
MKNPIMVKFNDLTFSVDIESILVEDTSEEPSSFYWEFNTKDLNGLFKVGYFLSIDGETDLKLKEVSIYY